jgi:hypothetical protein
MLNECMSRYAIDNVEAYLRPIGECYTLKWAWNGRRCRAESDLSDDDFEEAGWEEGLTRHAYPPKYKRFLHVTLSPVYQMNQLIGIIDDINSGERLPKNMKNEIQRLHS